MSVAIKFTGLQLKSETYTNKLGTAGQSTLVYEGPKALVFQEARKLFSFGWQVTSTNNGEGGKDNPIYTLTAVYQADLSQGGQPSGVTQPDPVWNVGGKAIQQAIFEIDRPLITNLSSDTKEKIEAALKNPNKGLPLVSAANISELPNAQKVYALAQIGIEGKSITANQVKRTITVPNKFVDNWSCVNEGKVFSKTSLINTYQVPYWVQSKLKDNNPQQTPIDNKSNITLMANYGYVEGPTEYQSVGSNTVQVSTEWTYGRYPVDLFDIM